MGEIFTYIVDMPDGIWGHCNSNSDGTYSVFINARLSYEIQKQIYLHELRHIEMNDFDKCNVDDIENEVRKEGYI